MNYLTTNNIKVFVLHIKDGYEERKDHMENMMSALHIPFEYILDGDISDLSQDILDSYFKTPLMHSFCPRASCSYKHYLAYQQVLSRNLEGALILEDDIILHHNFVEIFNNCMVELDRIKKKNAIISFEDSRLRFVPRSQRIKGKYLYEGRKDRMAGAYYITNNACRIIVNYVNAHKFDRPIDLLHAQLLQENILNYYWCHPTIATQGSFSGKFDSSISSKKEFAISLMWFLKLNYKKMLYEFR